MPSSSPQRPILLSGLKQNNLKNITVELPSKKLTVITGVSGSGKSSLAFDTLYAEGQRRYIESLSTYTRQFLEKMPKPDVDQVANIPPAIALEQRNTVVSSRSSVGTQTELVDYLRILFAKIGETECLECGGRVQKIDAETIVEESIRWLKKKKSAILAPLKYEPKKKATKKFFKEVLKVIHEQGFQRLALQKGKKFEILQIEDLQMIKDTTALEKAALQGKVYFVVDRLKLGDTIDSEARSRLNDSIGQALHLGREQVSLLDLTSHAVRHFDCRHACIQCGTEHRLPDPQLFSFNSPIGACPNCSGFGFTLDLDESLVVPDASKTLKNGAIDPLAKPSMTHWQKDLFRFAERQGISIGKRYSELTKTQKKLLWEGSAQDKTFRGIRGYFEELARKKYKLHVRVFIRRYQSQTLCSSCDGARLTAEALAVKIQKKSIADILALSITDALNWIIALKLKPRDQKIAQEVVDQVQKRLRFLEAVGVGYLTLSRLTKTLSGGEFQRICLATQLGNGLCGTLYVLDEPSIGLHAADTERLIQVLEDLRDQGNTIVVVEHDLEVMKAADWIVELGPAAGKRGGELIAQGASRAVEKVPGSLTGKYLKGDFALKRREPRPKAQRIIRIKGCSENNLKNISVDFPLERFVVVTGVSGSGKSTLVHQTLFRVMDQLVGNSRSSLDRAGAFDKIYGAEHIRGVVLLDQKPIGKNSRSNPATYLKAWDEVRRVYANQSLSLRRGYTPQHFSFNVDGGRCPVCKGEGEITLDMHFMAEVSIPCEECRGKRFKKNVLDVTYKGKNLHHLMNMTIDEAYDLFRSNSVLVRKFGILRDVGLGYLQVGQSAPTLSGGESQRLKIASVLENHSHQKQLYIFDEPTTGLHLEDVKRLLEVLQDLVANKNSIVMIEHHTDVIAQADWIIDLGPGGGELGGNVVATGTPDTIAKHARSATGKTLRKTYSEFSKKEARLGGTGRVQIDKLNS